MSTLLMVSEEISKAERAYREIRANILDGTYPPGTILSIRELSAQLNVSRTPVKEAISRLAYEGYVELYPDRPAFVSKISYTDVIELLEMRECLEGALAYHAALRRTDADLEALEEILEYHKKLTFQETPLVTEYDGKFHLCMAQASKNQRMASALENVFIPFTRITLPISKVESRFQRSLVQHTSIFSAIRDGNAELARGHMVEHIQDILSSVRDYQYHNLHLFK